MVARYITADEIVNRAAVEVGLKRIALPFSSSDPAFNQLTELLTSCGQELVNMYDWPQLTKEGSIVTTGSPNRYDVPSDYLKFIERSGWDSSNDAKLVGSITPGVWSYLVNEPVTATLYLKYREVQNQFWLFPTDTDAGITLPYEYIMRTWVQKADTSYDDVVSAADDTVLFEPVLMVKFLKLRFLEARGFDSTKAQDQFQLAYETHTGKTASGPTLNLVSSGRESLISADNAPDTGYGS